MRTHMASAITRDPGLFTISYLFAEAGQRCGYSINIGFSPHTASYSVYVCERLHIMGLLFAGQTSDPSEPTQARTTSNRSEMNKYSDSDK